MDYGKTLNLPKTEFPMRGNLPTREPEFLKEWEEQDIYDLVEKHNAGKPKFILHDGPPYANGDIHTGHVLNKVLKDMIIKYKSMSGYDAPYTPGWDTHGLPVELQVEKELGFEGKKDIEKFGIKEFNQKCREAVWKNEKAFRKLTDNMGQFIDLEHPYVTYDNNYIETEWWILKKFFDEGLIYNGLKILPYCPRCGTGLASHEVAQGYKEVTVNTVTVPFKLKEENTYLLVWTTTPWTLISNVAVCVNPNETYLKCNSKGYNFIVAEKLASKVLGDDYEVVSSYKGKDLEYKEYEQLMPFLTPNKKAFYITCDNYVTMDTGTGIVHLAPAFGQDDYEVGKKYDLPALNPVGEDGKYSEGPWTSRFVIDSELELEIIKWLKENDKLFKKEKISHEYPHCWRCKTPLLYYSKPSYYIKVTELKDKIIENNKTVNWHPSYVGEKRFGNWLENLNDWAISRNRYWGTPIPLWTCSCGYSKMIGSIAELKENAMEKIDEIDLHRPFVDEIHIKCPICGKSMTRINDVMDCWFDSGSMPFSQYHYPFENKELFEEQFPADFIAEGVDQTRGWFYTLLVISSFVMGKSPYKNVLVNDLLLDSKGQKMHKSRGNAIDPFSLIEEYGSDTIRWYLPYVSPVWTPIKFDIEGLKEVNSKFLSTLKNTYNFFAIYANADNIDIKGDTISYEKRSEIDKWLLSKYNKLVFNVTNYYDSYNLTDVVREITNFVSEDLSNWYIRRNRRRFWASEKTIDKQAVYSTTYEVLLGLSKLIAPITPFVSEDIYRKLTNGKSVHLEDFPIYNEKLIDDKIESRMDLVRNIISLGRNAREEAKIKVRQPISEVLIDGRNKSLIEDLLPLISEELNVKQVIFTTDLDNYMNFKVLPNFKEVGKIFGSKIKEFSDLLINLSNEEISKLNSNQDIDVMFDNEKLIVTPLMVDIRIQAKEGFNVAYLNNDFIILNTNLTDDLIKEGIAREMISKVQNLRKSSDFNIVDRINLYYNGDELVKEAVKDYEELIKNETLSLDIIVKDDLKEVYDLNGHNVCLKVERVSK